MVSKELFCKIIAMIQEQEATDMEFSRALDKVGDGHFIFGSGNKYYEALILLLKECVPDRYDYISWWLYEGEPDYKIWEADGSKEWTLDTPGALYDYLVEISNENRE